MFRQLSLKSLVGFGVCVFLILAGYRCLSDYQPNFKALSIIQNCSKSELNYDDVLLDISRKSLRIETWNYNFSQSGVEKLEDLVMEAGGTPVRSIVVSTWRSGSSFLGDLISSVPGSFYSYEPLKLLGTYKQLRKPSDAIRATNLIKNLFKCSFNETEAKKYLEFSKIHVKGANFFRFNRQFWQTCNNKQELCFNSNFIGRYCKLCPFHTMKLDRLRLPIATKILDDTELNVKVVLLIRDPRGVMMSRWNIENFCSRKREPDCANAGVVCADMVADYKAAVEFLHKYPNKFKILRYEDLAFNLEESTAELLNFFGLGVADSVRQFLKTHTSVSNSQHFSTFRKTKDVPFKWRKTLKFNNIKQIQEQCSEAMSLWGYERAHNASHIISPNFNPLIPFSIIYSRISKDSEKNNE